MTYSIRSPLMKKVGIVGMLTAALMVGASPAWASTVVSTNGGSATYFPKSNKMNIADTNCDSNDVYAQYKFLNSGSTSAPSNPTTIRNSSGCGSTVTVTLSPGGFSNIVFRHCTDDAFNDTCSSWVNSNA